MSKRLIDNGKIQYYSISTADISDLSTKFTVEEIGYYILIKTAYIRNVGDLTLGEARRVCRASKRSKTFFNFALNFLKDDLKESLTPLKQDLTIFKDELILTHDAWDKVINDVLNKSKKARESIGSRYQGKKQNSTNVDTNVDTNVPTNDVTNENVIVNDNLSITNRNTIKKNKQKKDFDYFTFEIPDFIEKQSWLDFLEMRKTQKAINSKTALTVLINKLTELKKQGHDVNEILTNSIMNSWKGVFAPNNNSKNQTTGSDKSIKNYDGFTQEYNQKFSNE